MNRIEKNRRGVILIVVLGILSLFALMAVTFVMVARQSRMSSYIDSHTEQVGDPPNKLADEVLKQILRGSDNPNSVLRPHGLLEDMYGNDAVMGRIDTSMPVQQAGTNDGQPFGSGRIIEFKVILDSDEDATGATSRAYKQLYYGYFNGLVLTMIGGAADGQSTRIIDYDVYPPPRPREYPPRRMQVLTFPNGVLPAVGDRFVINGRPFNGTGFGYSRGSFDTSVSTPTFLLDAFDPSFKNTNPTMLYPANRNDPTRAPYALLPNPVFFTPSTGNPYYVNASGQFIPDPYDDPAGPGGADEDYDVPDFQNMLLGAYVWDGTAMNVHIPSLHRPALVNYWLKQANLGSPLNVRDEWNNPGNNFAQTLRRKVLLRPSSLDHFNDLDRDGVRDTDGKVFTEPDFANRMGAVEFDATSTEPLNWDVDNDGDGVPDSIWVDLGFPVQSSPDGRLYKPLVAVLCIDMDGKINLNAHGTMHHAVAANPADNVYRNQYHDATYPTGRKAVFPDYPTSSNVPLLPVGQGYGPAEINPATGGVNPVTGRLDESLFPAPGLRNLDSTSFGGSNMQTPRYGQPVSSHPDDTLRRLLVGYSESMDNAQLAPLGLSGTAPIAGRYGEVPAYEAYAQPGMTFNPNYNAVMPGTGPDLADNLGKWYTPSNYWSLNGYTYPLGGFAYGSPPDMDGDAAIAFDPTGQPMYVSKSNLPDPIGGGVFQQGGLGEPGDNVNDPYEIDLSLTGATAGYLASFPDGTTAPVPIDAPFTVFELERVLRYYDTDTRELPDRILRLTEPLLGVRRDQLPDPADPTSAQLKSLFSADEFTPQLDNEYSHLYVPSGGSPDNPAALKAARRRLVTTASFDLPTYNLSPLTHSAVADFSAISSAKQNNNWVASYQADPTYPPRTLVDLLAARLQLKNPSYDGTVMLRNAMMSRLPGGSNPNYTQRSFNALLSPDLLAGLRMDLNRPFGNAVDDLVGGVNNGVVDDPVENSINQQLWPVLSATANTFPPVYADADNDGYSVNLGTGSEQQRRYGILARQYYARQLYVLARLVLDSEFQNLEKKLESHPDFISLPLQTRQIEATAEAARRFAQWAINVVDFRDADSIMTPFVYDIYPFTDNTSDAPLQIYTWDIDPLQNPLQVYQAPGPAHGVNGHYADVVWGMERPELLITETLAMHDRRTVDGTRAPAGPSNGNKTTSDSPADNDFDQEKRPVGSLFVELFNPTGLNEQAPAEMYEPDVNYGNVPAIALNKVSPTDAAGNTGAPIWRMAVLDPTKTNTTVKAIARNPVVQNGDPGLDRAIYFTNKPAVTNASGGLATGSHYYYQVGAPAYQPGVPTNIYVQRQRYAVVGPAKETEVVGLDGGGTKFSIHLDTTRTSHVDVSPAGAMTYRRYQQPLNQVQQAVPVVVNGPRRLSISEPYVGGDSKYDAWETTPGRSANLSDLNTAEPLDDTPWDDSNPDLKVSGTYTDDPNASNNNNEGYRLVALQRLADPTRPYHATQNPYVIVDSMPVDLTVYTSESVVTSPEPSVGTTGVTNLAGGFNFSSRQRGSTQRAQLSRPSSNPPAGGYRIPNLWYSWTQLPTNSPKPGDTKATYSLDTGTVQGLPIHTLGYLNLQYFESSAGGPVAGATPLTQAQTSQFDALPMDSGQYVGAPPAPFATFLWANRPFVSGTELMDVPWTNSSEFVTTFSSWRRNPKSSVAPTPYAPGPVVNQNPGIADHPFAPYRHLPNYDNSSSQIPASFTAASYVPNPPTWLSFDSTSQAPLDFHRLLEFVQVPSRFAGTQEMVPTTDLSPQGYTSGTPNPSGNHTLHPPFNFISRYRDPGRINLNTIFDGGQTMRAIMNRCEFLNTAWNNNPNFLWQRVIDSRRGYGTGAGALTAIPTSPTFFANPFRSESGGNLVPIEAMRRQNVVPGGNYRNMVDSTLLRPDPTNLTQPLFTFDPQQAYLNGDTNANVRNLIYQKLGNTVTTRSNVYAIWITIGYFEVQQVDTTNALNAAAYPDGFRLKQELGIDTGDVKRHRAFYIIDRTIPVGFVRGQDLNVEKTILLRRFIE